MNRFLKYSIIAIMLLLIQSTFANFITLEDIAPDFLLMFVIFISIVEGKLNAMIYAFLLGLIFDMITGGVIGLSSLSKVVAVFVTGFFYNPNKIQLTLGSYKFVLIVLLGAIIHNTIYFIVFLQGTEFNFWQALLKFGVTSAFYTSVVSVLLVLFLSRKYGVMKNV